MADDQHQTRDGISRVAAELTAHQGFARVSMRAIAAAAQVSKPVLCYYFESKVGLLVSLIEENLAQMDAATRQIPARDLPLSQRLRQAIAVEFRVAIERPELLRLYVGIFGNLDRYPEVAGYLRGKIASHTAIEDSVEQGQTTGAFRADIGPAAAVGVLRGIVGHFVGGAISGTGVELSDGLADRLFSVFVEGMQKRPGPEVAVLKPVSRGRSTGGRSRTPPETVLTSATARSAAESRGAMERNLEAGG